MKRYFYVSILWIFIFFLFPSKQASAQHGDTPPLPSDAWNGQVIGKVVNQTSGETVAEPVDVMLHAWDAEGKERLMVHEKAGADGSYRFEDVDFHQSFKYAVMATYLGATYFSPSVGVEQGEDSVTVNAQVYDITSDLSTIKIDQLQVVFYVEANQIGVTQFYALSNSGLRTVKDAVTLPRDRTGTLKFHLPDEAQNVEFGNDTSTGRYVLLPGGFADTAPVPPGEDASQVIVAYNLPYTGKLDYIYLAQVEINRLSFLVLEGSGLSLKGRYLTPAGVRTLQDGSKFDVFTASSLKPGEIVQLTLSGKLKGGTNLNMTLAKMPANTKLGISAGILGLTLVGTGVWLLRRTKVEKTAPMSLGELFVALEQLEDAHDRGEVAENEYREMGTELLARVKLAIREKHDDEPA